MVSTYQKQACNASERTQQKQHPECALSTSTAVSSVPQGGARAVLMLEEAPACAAPY
jgi:hypothetical protein